ncbi:hypothetical protein [Rhodohalobacter sulfatireducens]|uniref:5-bromo-4-chloroindolyl phosphate hydrolysis protein n=1 Tax=Rhodohalobacter sulfatireducens TaxID=2911366 RepID=A0ABS9KFC6_9BACT|nr:hypothetical protein [Rhodohalobacter sulfatireducens]MCG2589558.1 hypothetical protein [Rhodohalobacter sulfatireducens]MDR9364924.1 hypothetical protein [Balneolaceae bacterium]MDR9409071.1 hypothetical protein [Balneolaceae bacterium]
MAKDNESSINFTKEAFLHPVNLVCLLVGTITALVLNDVGLISNAILAFTFGVELMYLGIVPKLPAFQKSMELKKRREQSDESNDKVIFYQLDARSQKRFLVLKHITKEVKQNFDTLPYTSKGMLEHIENKVDDLLSTYLTLLDMNRRFQIYMNSEVEEEIRREVEEQENDLETIDSEKLKKTRQRRLSILNKRLNKFDVAKEKYLICETHLETIEDAVRYIYEQSMTMPNAEDVGTQLDHLLSEMEETTNIIEEMDSNLLPGFEDMDRELELAQLKKEAQELRKETGEKVKKSI